MTAKATVLEGCFILEPKVFEDERGYFFESYNQSEFERITGQRINFVQDNQALSNYGVIRGLHFQKEPFAQAKLVRIITGKVLDVVVDLRKTSKTYLKIFTIELSAENRKQLFIPGGFAHGYSVLADHTIFSYKCNQYYNKASESGINCKDPSLKIDWLIPEEKQILSTKDLALPFLKDLSLS